MVKENSRGFTSVKLYLYMPILIFAIITWWKLKHYVCEFDTHFQEWHFFCSLDANYGNQFWWSRWVCLCPLTRDVWTRNVISVKITCGKIWPEQKCNYIKYMSSRFGTVHCNVTQKCVLFGMRWYSCLQGFCVFLCKLAQQCGYCKSLRMLEWCKKRVLMSSLGCLVTIGD